MLQPSESRLNKTFRIALVDDHPMVRERLSEVINHEPDLEICGEAEDRFQALQMLGEMLPDLAIVDLTLKCSHGLELIKDLQAGLPSIRILVVSMQEEILYAERTIRAGAHGYITKQEATRDILVAIRRVLAGDIYLSTAMASRITSNILGKQRSAKPATVESLADRELQVFELIGAGFNTKEVAEQLCLDVKTIETYRARIKEKLGLKDASELLRRAIMWVHRHD